MFKYLENHPYKTTIGIIIGVMAIILAVIFWRFPVSNDTKNENVNAISVFDLVGKISSEKSTLAKQNKLAEYYNAPVKDSGFIIDVGSDYGSQDQYIVATIAKNLEKNEYDRYIAPSVECKFLENWSKNLLATDFSKEIKFTGTIPNKDNYINQIRLSSDSLPKLEIDNCAIVN
jgi:hypothetical protein